MANRTIYVKNIDEFIEKIVQSGFSYRQLARQVGTSQTTISLIINGERNPSPELAVKICKALNCQFEDIFSLKLFTTANKSNNKRFSRKWAEKS